MFNRINGICALIALFLAMLVLLGVVGNVSAETFQVNSGDSIQEKINNAGENDIIYVYPATYSENLVVDKKISLIGIFENHAYPVINAMGMDNCINITADNVIVKGFTTENSAKSGVRIESANCLISDITSRNNGYGFYISNNDGNNRIFDSSASNNLNDGIVAYFADNNYIFNTTLTDNGRSGICIGHSESNTIYNNCFNNSAASKGNIYFHEFTYTTNIWNVSKTQALNIMGGPYLGGNYYSDNPKDPFDDVFTNEFTIAINNKDNLPLRDYIPIPPGQVSGLKNSTYEMDFIRWTWEDPDDSDLDKIIITYQNTEHPVPKGVQFYNMTDLLPGTRYNISVFTVDLFGAKNETPVTANATTAPNMPPEKISNLTCKTGHTWINLTWNDPADDDLKEINITVQNLGEYKVSKTIQVFNLTGLSPDTEYNFEIYSVDKYGLNSTPLIKSVLTRQDPTPLTGVLNLDGNANNHTSITWQWNNPDDPELDQVIVNFKGTQKLLGNNTEFFTVLNLCPDTKYDINISTRDLFGVCNNTPVNFSVKTLKDPTPLTGVLNLNGNANNHTSITWQWNNPNDQELDQVIVNFKGTQKLLGNNTEFFTADNLIPETEYDINITTRDLFGVCNNTPVNFSVKTLKDPTPLTAVRDLINSSYATDYINWTWNDPEDPDLLKVVITFEGNMHEIEKGIGFFNATNLISNFTYEISAYTVDIFGVENRTENNASAMTKPDNNAPHGVKNLINSTFARDYILWTWDDPADPDFKGTEFSFENNTYFIEKGVCCLNITGLKPDTVYRINSSTTDYSGNINSTIVYSVSKTAPDQSLLTSVSDLMAIDNGTEHISINWTDPADPDFKEVRIYVNGVIVPVQKGIKNYTITGLLSGTEYNIGTKTADIFGNLNSTWVNITASTSADKISPDEADSNSQSIPSGQTAGGGGYSAGAHTYTNTGPLITSSEGKVLRDVIVSSQKGNYLINIIIPKNTAATDINGNPAKTITINTVKSDLADYSDNSYKYAGISFNLEPDNIRFDPAIKIVIQKDELSLDSQESREYSLKYFNEGTLKWEDVPTHTDRFSGDITGELSHFSSYALFYKPAPLVSLPLTDAAAAPFSTQTEKEYQKVQTDEKTAKSFIDLIVMFFVTLVAVFSSIYLIRTEVYKVKFFRK